MHRAGVSSVVAALSAVMFIQVAPAATTDTTTQGNWIGVYGSDGYILSNYIGGGPNTHTPALGTFNDVASLPSYVSSYSYGGGTQGYVWEVNSFDVRDPQNPLDPDGGRTAATAFDHGPYSVDLVLGEQADFRLAVYALDWDRYDPQGGPGRDISIEVNGESVRVNNVDAPGPEAYRNGTWVQFDVIGAQAGPLSINIIQNNNLNSNAVISAIAFDAIPEPTGAAVLGAAGLIALARRRRF